MSSAQLDIHPDDELAPDSAAALPPLDLPRMEHTERDVTRPALKQQVAERLAAHRARRGHIAEVAAPQTRTDSAPARPAPARPAPGRSAHIAAAVAERYAHSQSYRAFLAAEAERAVHQADAAAQVATINAQAIALAQQKLLADLDNWDAPTEMPSGPVAVPTVPLSAVDYAALFGGEPVFAHSSTRDWSTGEPAASVAQAPSFTVRPYEDDTHTTAAARTSENSAVVSNGRFDADQTRQEIDEDERLALDDEIAFRHNPVFDEALHGELIAANLIEFPRQLVAARKVRPRLAEGPLRDGEAASNQEGQLRIFEVESDHLSSVAAMDSIAPEWSSILLSALPVTEFTGTPDVDYLATFVPQAAPMSLRLMAAAVDACLIVTVQLAFTAVFALALTHLSGLHAAFEIPRMAAVGGTVATLAVLALLYQLLFFTLSDATPGMRYARIGLCTFSDENPTRSAMRRRIFATVIAAFPLGLGLLWAFLDEDTLGWHDRISRIYQRAY